MEILWLSLNHCLVASDIPSALFLTLALRSPLVPHQAQAEVHPTLIHPLRESASISREGHTPNAGNPYDLRLVSIHSVAQRRYRIVSISIQKYDRHNAAGKY